MGIMELLIEEGVLETPNPDMIYLKKSRVEFYLNYSKNVGRLDGD